MVIYCERAGDGFWAEPANTLSTLAFFVAAWMAVRLLRGLPPAPGGDRRWDLLLLAGSVFAVGVAGFLWHSLAETWAELLDLGAMLVFLILFLISFLSRIAGVGVFGIVVVLLGVQWLMLQTGSRFSPTLMNGGVFFYPAAAVLWVVALFAMVQMRSRGWPFLVAAAGFSIALVLRNLDLALCLQWPWGTHFAWQLLVAGAMYQLFRGLTDSVALTRSEPARNLA
mgnify:CR=1 FL=1